MKVLGKNKKKPDILEERPTMPILFRLLAKLAKISVAKEEKKQICKRGQRTN